MQSNALPLLLVALTIFDDLEAGAELMTLRAAKGHRYMRRDGREPDLTVMYRLASRGTRGPDGVRVVLETVNTSSGKCTTEAALMRFLKRINGARTQPSASAAAKAHAAAEARLIAAGI